MKWFREFRYFREIHALAGVFDIFLLMIANLAILHGFEYTPIFVRMAFLGEGAFYSNLTAIMYLWTLSLFQIEYRLTEVRSGNTKKF